MSRANRSLVLIIGLLMGCTSQDVWQADIEITPISYEVPGETLDRTIGMLRRLAIIPGKFESRADNGHDPPIDNSGKDVSAENLRSTFIFEATNFLTNERGYDVQPLDPSNFSEPQDATLEGFLQTCSEDLIAWADEPDLRRASPVQVESCVKRIGSSLKVDGLIVIGGSRVSDRDWRFALTLLTASMAWPTLMAQEQIEASANLFEVSSGRIVWRSRFSKSAAEPTAPRVAVGFLFEDLEHALPEVLIE